MRGVRLRCLSAVAAVALALATPAIALGGSPVDPTPGPAVDLGSMVSVGLGVSPLGVDLPTLPIAVGGPLGEPGRPTAPEPEGKALSFDVRLRWPGTEGSPLEPYLSFGPALFVVEPDYAGLLLGTRPDPTVRLGARAGAGVNWRLGKDVTLFGAYEVSTTGESGLSSGARAGSEPVVGGYDFTYGIRFRF